MFLSDKDIDAAVRSGVIIIKPFEKKQMQPASYDVTLGTTFMVQKSHSNVAIDPVKLMYPETETVEVGGNDAFVLQPGSSVTGVTREYCGSDTHLIRVNGKSGLSRVGLLVHNSIGIVNPGHFLNIVLELTNLSRSPILLRPGMEIAQLTFSPLTSVSRSSYQEKKRHSFVGLSGYVPPKRGPLARKKTKRAKK